MSTRQNIIDVLEGKEPEITPYFMYDGMMDGKFSGIPTGTELEPWKDLLDSGLGVCQHCNIFNITEHNIKRSSSKQKSGTDICVTHKIETPVGSLEHRSVNGWHEGKWIHDDNDYVAMKWVIENSELSVDEEKFNDFEKRIGDYGFTVLELLRTPMQTLNIDIAGTERFCMDYGLEIPGLFELFEAYKKFFMRKVELISKSKGRYVKVLENPTFKMLGPDYYKKWLLPIYNEMAAVLDDKRIIMHFDSETACVKDLIAASPFHMLESLTEPPEGDLLYDECRRAWPDKVLLCNINVGLYSLPPLELKQAISDKRTRAGKKGVAFEISEDMPANWRESIPIVLDTLKNI